MMTALDGIGPRAATLVCATLALSSPLAAHGGSASGDAGDGDSSGSSGGGLQLASEAVGTLPTWWVEDGVGPVAMPQAEQTDYQSDAHLQILVPETHLTGFALEASGEGYVFLSLPPEQEGLVRVRFFGDVRVELDRDLVQSAGLPIDVHVGADNQSGLGLVAVDGVFGSSFELAVPGGALDVPLGTSPAYDALFAASSVSLYTVAPAPEESESGWDVGRLDLAVTPEAYRVDQHVIETLL